MNNVISLFLIINLLVYSKINAQNHLHDNNHQHYHQDHVDQGHSHSEHDHLEHDRGDHGHVVSHSHDAHESEDYSITEIEIDEEYFHQIVDNKSSSIVVKYLNRDIPFELKEFKFYDGNKNPIPGMHAYRMRAKTDGLLQGRLVVSPHGVNMMFLSGGTMVRQYYRHTDSGKKYVEEVGFSIKDMPLSGCGTSDHTGSENQILKGEKSSYTDGINKQFGNHKRVFRVAISTTGEYYQNNGGSVSRVRAAVAEQMIAISFIYEQDLNVQMVLSGSPRADYTDPMNDPFIPQGSRTGMAGAEVNNRFNSRNFDIGHVFHTHPSGGDWLANGGGSGGVAALGSVCRDGSKANAWSGSFSNNNNGFISLAAHEFGHQFGARHTFNGIGGSCDAGNISLQNTYEFASGVTVMSYNGICGAGQNILSETGETNSEAFNYFHVASLVDMTRHLESPVAEACNIDDWTLDANNEPVANANPCGAVYRIPTSTPFFLLGDGTDADGDTLLYTWEQFDNDPSGDTQGEIGDDAALNNRGPIFRCYPPNRNPIRYFPKRGLQLEGFNSYDFEVLPRRARSLTMRFIARDNAFDGGAVDWDQINIQVVSSSFRITSPDGTGQSFSTGEELRVEWDVRGAEDLCDRAEIRISVDGGSSFPYIAASNVDFGRGFQDVTIPDNIPTTERMRFQVICDDYECFGFYDFSSDDITLTSQCNNTTSSAICNTEPLVANFRDGSLDLGNPIALGFEMVNYITTVEATPPTMALTAFSNGNRNDCRQSGPDNPFDQVIITPTESGVYHFEFNDDDRDISAYSIFDRATFDSNNPCPSFIGSNSHHSGSSFVPRRYMRVELESCREYVLISQVTSNNAFNTAIRTIYGPGQLLGTVIDNVATTFVAVNVNDNIIRGIAETGNFIFLDPGEYEVHSVVYDGVDPNSFLGQTISQISSGGCTSVSLNSQSVTINSTCAIVGLDVQTTEACNFRDNMYNVSVTFEVELGPSSGNVTINGQTFPFNGGRNTVELVDLVADGMPVDLSFSFSEDAGCTKTEFDVFVAPENCCLIDIDLGDQRVCTGEVAMLDAGDDGVLYTWFRDGERLPETSSLLSAIDPGEYMVIVEDVNGCQKSDATTVAFDDPPFVDIVTDDIDDACVGDVIRIEAEVSGWDSISWLRNGRVVEELENDFIIRVEDAGIFEIQVFNGGCMTNDFISVALTLSTPFSIGGDLDECVGIPITLESDNPDLDYTWVKFGEGEIANGTSTLLIDGDSTDDSGRFIAIGVNELGCPFRDTVRIDYEIRPDIDLGDDVSTCEGNTININTGGVSPVEWFVDGVIVPNLNFGNFNNPPNGVIEAVARISDNCIERDTIVVTVNPLPQIEAGPNLSFCEGAVIDTIIKVGERDGTQYLYEFNGEVITTASPFTGELQVTEPGEYTVIGSTTDGTRCFAFDEFIVEFVDNPSLTIISAPQELCVGNEDAIVLDASSDGIAWFLNGRLLDESTTVLMISEPGTYEAVIGLNQDCEARVTTVVESIPSPDLTLEEVLDGCSGAPVELVATNENNLTIAWFENGSLIAGENEGSLTVDRSGEFVIVVSDEMGCQSRDTVNVLLEDASTVELDDELTFCSGDIGLITAITNSSTLTWYNGTQQLPFTGTTIEVTTEGIYRAVAQEGQDCEASDEVVVSFSDRPDITLQADSACQGRDLEIFVGPDDAFFYSWFVNGEPISNQTGTLIITESDLGGLTGEISVRVQNREDDCFTEATTEVSFLDGSTLSLMLDGAICDNVGQIVAETNATSLQWFLNGEELTETGTTLEVSEGGTYTAIAGSGPCMAEETIEVTFGSSPDIMLEDTFACGMEDAVFVAGPDSDFEYSWTINGLTQNETSGTFVIPFGTLPTGNARIGVTVRNLNDDCETTSEARVEFLDFPDLSLTIPTDLCEGTPDFLVANSDQSTLTWFRNGEELDETSRVLEVSTSGLYLAEARNGGCIVSDSVDLVFAESPDIELGSISSCSTDDAVFIAGPDAAFDYAWTINQIPLAETSGTLTVASSMIATSMAEVAVTATGSNGCQTSRTATVEFITSSEVVLEEVEVVCEGEATFIVAQTSVSALSWFQDGEQLLETSTTLEVREPGLYLAIAGSGECATRDSIVVTEDNFVEAPMISISNVTSCASDDAVFIAGPNDLDYEWTVGGVLQSETSETLTLSSSMVPGGSAEVNVIAINDNGCRSTAVAMVEFTDSPTLSLMPPTGACDGSSVTIISETNVSSLVWFFNGQQRMEDGTSLEINESGLYTAVAGTGICAARDSIEVTFGESPDLDDLDDQQECAGEPAIFTAGPDGTFLYTWFIDNEEQSETTGTLTVNSNDVSNLNGTISVIATDLGGECSATREANVEFLDIPSLSIIDPGPLCQGTMAFLEVDTDVQSIEWFVNNELQTTTGPSIEITVDGEYEARAGSGRCAVTESITITLLDAPNVSLESQSECLGETAEFIAGPNDAFDYMWFVDGNELMETGGSILLNDSDINGMTAEVVVVATNLDGSCATESVATLEFLDTPSLSIIDPGPLCQGTMASLEVDTDVQSIEWFINDELQTTTGPSIEITVDGEYEARAGSGICGVSESIVITLLDAPDVTISNQSICLGESGEFVAGNDDEFDYMWLVDGLEVSETSGTLTLDETMISGTSAEIRVEATTLDGSCTSSSEAILEFLDTPSLTFEDPGDICNGETGELTASTNVQTLTWLLNDESFPQTATTITIDMPGEYTAIAGSGVCEITQSILVEFVDAPDLSIEASQEEACAGDNVEITLTNDTNEPVEWTIGNMTLPDVGNTISAPESGTYTALVTNSEGCSSEASVDVTFFEFPSAQILNLPMGVCEGSGFEIEAESNGDRFEWFDENGPIPGATGLSQEFDVSGDYIFVAYNEIDCPTEVAFTLEFIPAPSVDLGSDVRECADQDVVLEVADDPDVEYEWFLNGTALGEIGNSIIAIESGQYQVVATNAQVGCSSEDIVMVELVELPTITNTTGSDQITVCEFASERLSVSSDSDMLVWMLNGEIIAENVDNIEATLSGTYTVIASRDIGCETTFDFTVDVISLEPLQFGNVSLCPGDNPVELTIDGNFDSYSWEGGNISETTQTISIPWTPTQSTTMTDITVMGIREGCASETTFNLTIFPELNVDVENLNPEICLGGAVQLNVSGAQNYSWMDPNGSLSSTTISNPIANPETTTTYQLTVSDDNCPSEDQLEVTVFVNPLPVISAGEDRSTIPGETVILMASGADSYIWDNDDLIIGSNSDDEVEVDISEETTFTVIGTDINGCSSSDEVIVSIVADPSLVINVIDALTPNGDGANEELEFLGLESFPQNRLTIFNRWGNIVFEKRGYQNDNVRWNGTRNGEDLAAGTYYYILEFGEFQINNSLTIIRE